MIFFSLKTNLSLASSTLSPLPVQKPLPVVNELKTEPEAALVIQLIPAIFGAHTAKKCGLNLPTDFFPISVSSSTIPAPKANKDRAWLKRMRNFFSLSVSETHSLL